MIVLLNRPEAYWVCTHITDEVVTVNGSRVNLDLLYRVLLAKRMAALRLERSTPELP